MGTRSITTVHSQFGAGDDAERHVVIYRHWDGYPYHHGRYLFEFLDGMHIGNGRQGDEPEKYANGPGRLAALLVAALVKDGHEPDLMKEVDDCGQEYHYDIRVVNCTITEVVVYSGPVTAFGLGGEECNQEIFRGTVAHFGEWANT